MNDCPTVYYSDSRNNTTYNVDYYSKNNKKYLYSTNIVTKYLKLSNQIVFDKGLLNFYDQCLLAGCVGFETFATIYNNCYSTKEKTYNVSQIQLYRKRLSEAWFTYKLRSILNNFDNFKNYYFDAKSTEFELEKFNYSIKIYFIKKWSETHSVECTDCSKEINLGTLKI